MSVCLTFQVLNSPVLFWFISHTYFYFFYVNIWIIDTNGNDYDTLSLKSTEKYKSYPFYSSIDVAIDDIYKIKHIHVDRNHFCFHWIPLDVILCWLPQSVGIPQSVVSLYGFIPYSCPSLLLLKLIEGITLPLWIVPAYANDIILSHFNPMSKFTHTETT